MRKLISILILSLLVNFAMGQNSIKTSAKYICPPCNASCDGIEHDSPGVCPHCNMVYVRKDFSKTIAFYLQDGVEVLDFAGPMEVFAYAGYEVFTVSATQKPIRSQGILTVTPDYSIENAPKADILAFFGGNSAAAYKNKKVIDWIKSQEDVQYYFSVCTGAFVLAESGILDGKTATTFHNSLDDLESQYPEVDVRKNVRFVDNGKVITTAGISAGIDGALHLVAKLQGLNAAKRTAYYMEYDNWNIGDGLILATDNPYNVPSKPDLSIFEGTYEYKDNTHLVLAYDEANGNLNAKIQGTNYPIYHEKEDLFSDTNSQPVFFKRNEKNEIVGYELIENTRLFKKLN
ncbi:DJ-1/PfpI family protein [Pelagihabitans pacificus]|nr:DJ-1/PfpI family protein [Pelagihabitans pacificus]